MTESNRTEPRNRAMKAVDHTHPDTGRPFGEQVVFARGPTVAADGGEPSEARRTTDGEREADVDETGAEEAETEEDGTVRMKDVDHEPPNESDANRVFERGREGRDGDR